MNRINAAAKSARSRRGRIGLCTVALAALIATTPASADGDADLAQYLTNPIANLVTIPIQMNFDQDIGPGDDGTKITTNVQPVIPFDIGADWNLITRTIVPVIHNEELNAQAPFSGHGQAYAGA